MTLVKPFLDNKGTNGATHTSQGFQPDMRKNIESRVKANRRKSNRLTYLKWKAIEFKSSFLSYQQKNPEMDAGIAKWVEKAKKNLGGCCANALYRRHLSNNEVEFVAAHSCGHRLCPICNSLRQKKTRRKYLEFFQQNQVLTMLKNKKTGKNRPVTKNVLNKLNSQGKIGSSYAECGRVDYDLMHLTLTVPHYAETGFRGYDLYFDQLIRSFNLMRKDRIWNQDVYGGFYSVETSKKGSGFHIHLHCMLMVRRFKGNRNTIYKNVLKMWNKRTINPYSDRDRFPEKTVNTMLRTLLSVKKNEPFNVGSDQYKEAVQFIESLHPKGATMIGLKTLFHVDKDGKKHYVQAGSKASDITHAVMECLKYTFKADVFKNDDGTPDVESIIRIYPEIEGKPLYSKFGSLIGEKELNINYSNNDSVQEIMSMEGERIEEMVEDYYLSGAEEVYNPKTLQPAGRDEYEYVVCSPAWIWHKAENSNGEKKIVSSKLTAHGERKKTHINQPSTLAAIASMYEISLTKMVADSIKSNKVRQAINMRDFDRVNAYLRKTYKPKQLKMFSGFYSWLLNQD